MSSLEDRFMGQPSTFILSKIKRRLRSYYTTFSYQAKPMLKILTWQQNLYFIFLCFRHCKSLLKTGRFLSVDAALVKSIDVLYPKIQENKIVLPVREIEGQMDQIGNDGSTLELVRELFGNAEYTRMFKSGMKCETVIDVGSNRGFFMLVAWALWESRRIVCIEPQQALANIRQQIAKANKIPFGVITEYKNFCSSNNKNSAVSINQILKENSIESIDFLKMDVEGAEADIFSGNLEWLNRCRNIAMEIHYSMADVGFIPSLLRSKGFTCFLTDLQGKPIEDASSNSALSRGCAYLYASSSGDLR